MVMVVSCGVIMARLLSWRPAHGCAAGTSVQTIVCGDSNQLRLCLWRPVRPPGYGAHPVRLIVARCEVRYSGRLSAVLPEALRLLMIKSDGSVMVHSDAGGYKPENWMTPPTVIEESAQGIVVRKVREDDRLDIRIAEVVSDVTHDMGEAAALQKDGVERELQELLAAAPEWCGEGLRLVRREWATDIGPGDLMCRATEGAGGRV